MPKQNPAKFRLVLIAMLLLPLLFVFQNCDRLTFKDQTSQSGNGQGYDGLSSSGNGQGYDGFASVSGVYKQYINGESCSAGILKTYSAKIDFGSEATPLASPQVYNNGCGPQNSIDLAPEFLTIKPYSSNFATYENGVFELQANEDLTAIDSPQFFCRSTADQMTGIDTVIRFNSNTDIYTAEIYIGKTSEPDASSPYIKQQVTRFPVTRSLSTTGDILLTAEHFRLTVQQFKNNQPSAASLNAKIDGETYFDVVQSCQLQNFVSPFLLPSVPPPPPSPAPPPPPSPAPPPAPPPANVAPVANFSFTCSYLNCSFTNSSTDSDGAIASQSWTFGDGTSSTLASPNKSYTADGTFSVKLTVTDDDGATNSITRAVTVAAYVPPVVVSVNGSTADKTVASMTSLNFTATGLGDSTTATGWARGVDQTSSSVTFISCPSGTSSQWESIQANGWVPSTTPGKWTANNAFQAWNGVPLLLTFCLRNSATGKSDQIRITVLPP